VLPDSEAAESAVAILVVAVEDVTDNLRNSTKMTAISRRTFLCCSLSAALQLAEEQNHIS
jgi:hypothetical protein